MAKIASKPMTEPADYVQSTPQRSSRRQMIPSYVQYLLPALTIYGVFFLLPTALALPISLTNWTGVGTNQAFVGVSNYLRLLTSPAFLNALGHNALMFVVFMVLVNTVALGLATILDHRPPGHEIYRAIIFLPIILSMVATGFIWSLMLDPTIGIINPLLTSIGLGSLSQQWLSTPHLALATVIFVQWWHWGPLPMVIYLAGLKTVPAELKGAAAIDGCSHWQAFRHVTFPLLRPAFAVNTVLSFITSFQVFTVVYILEGVLGSPGGATDVISTLIYRTAFGTGTYGTLNNLGYAVANGVGAMILLGSIVAILVWFFGRREVQM